MIIPSSHSWFKYPAFQVILCRCQWRGSFCQSGHERSDSDARDTTKRILQIWFVHSMSITTESPKKTTNSPKKQQVTFIFYPIIQVHHLSFMNLRRGYVAGKCLRSSLARSFQRNSSGPTSPGVVSWVMRLVSSLITSIGPEACGISWADPYKESYRPIIDL